MYNPFIFRIIVKITLAFMKVFFPLKGGASHLFDVLLLFTVAF